MIAITLKMIRFAICATGTLLSACATHVPVAEPAPVTRVDSQSPALPADPQPPNRDVQARLLAHHATWRGVPHA